MHRDPPAAGRRHGQEFITSQVPLGFATCELFSCNSVAMTGPKLSDHAAKCAWQQHGAIDSATSPFIEGTPGPQQQCGGVTVLGRAVEQYLRLRSSPPDPQRFTQVHSDASCNSGMIRCERARPSRQHASSHAALNGHAILRQPVRWPVAPGRTRATIPNADAPSHNPATMPGTPDCGAAESTIRRGTLDVERRNPLPQVPSHDNPRAASTSTTIPMWRPTAQP